MLQHNPDGTTNQEWLQARCGKVTASGLDKLMAKTKSGPAASRKNYMADLICERLTGEPVQIFQTAAMKWGIETEAEARGMYMLMEDVDVLEVGFVDHPTIEMTGASPDGLVGGNGLVEIKCPNTATHIQTLLDKKIPARYITQMMWQMACTDRAWCDYVSYDPRIKVPTMQYFCMRVHRDSALIEEYETEVEKFIEELDTTVLKLRSEYE